MDMKEQEEMFEKLKKELSSLNQQFDEIMKKNNFTKEDLQIDEDTLSPEIAYEWSKLKNQITDENTSQTVRSSTRAGMNRKNIIRI